MSHTRPMVNLKPNAMHSSLPGERIISFFSDKHQVGCLVSLKDFDDHFHIEIYRCDPGVVIVTPRLEDLQNEQ